ncbi:MAG: triosephosphate isomerase [Bacteroides sp. SM23_62_1]|nr:MAG: triosephosphate isomerase [Bacteroides sp. SM23_62_1]
MRKKIVAGNWKMNTTIDEGLQLAREVNRLVDNDPGDVLVIVAPPFSHLSEIKKVLSVVALSAQNCASENRGAFTGEVSAEMIKSTGAEYVIIGHSERRTLFREEDEILLKKVKLALESDLIPIFCCGEKLSEREQGKHFITVQDQLASTLFMLEDKNFRQIIIAYEPVWAIGTGLNATPEQAQEMHEFIRRLIGQHFNTDISDAASILYGGSCKPSNAKELFDNPDVDGGLIGGASLNANDFFAIVKSI